MSEEPDIIELRGHGHAVNSVEFSPDGTKIVSACSDNSVRVWDVDTEVCENTFENHCQGKMVRNPDYIKPVSEVIASTKIASAEEIADEFEGHELRVRRVGLPRLAEGGAGDSGAGDSGADTKATPSWYPRPEPEEQFVKKPGNVYSARFSPDGTKIVSAGSDHIVRMWDYNKLSGGSSIRRKTSKRKTSRRKTSRRKTSRLKTSKRMKLNRKKMKRGGRKLKNKTRRRRSR